MIGNLKEEIKLYLCCLTLACLALYAALEKNDFITSQ